MRIYRYSSRPSASLSRKQKKVAKALLNSLILKHEAKRSTVP